MMNAGKLTNEQLTNLVLSKLPPLSSNTLVGANIGADCAWINMGDILMVTSSDPITAGGMQSGTLTVHVSCNDIAACGVRPSGLLVDIIAPTSCTEEDISYIVESASKEASSLGVDIVGGHTEVSDSVNTFVVISTAFGVITKDHPVPKGTIKAGDKLIQTKLCGIEGSYIAATEHKDKLVGKVSEDFINEAANYSSLISVVKEGDAAGSVFAIDNSVNSNGFKNGAVSLMHDVTEGGILGAAYEMAHFSGLGVEVDERLIPISDATKNICECLDINPFRLISSGSLLIATSEAERVIEAVESVGVKATVIGEFKDKAEGFKRVDRISGELLEMDPPGADEIYKL